jgi:hypothetical protein
VKTKLTRTLAFAAISAALCGIAHGQSAALNTNAPLVIQATNTPGTGTQGIEIAPEIRAEMLEAAAREIGQPEPGDHDKMLARHAALKQQILVIQQHHPRATTNAPTTLTTPAASAAPAVLAPTPASVPGTSPATGVKPVGLKPRHLPSDQLGRIINELSEVRAQLIETLPIQAAQ